MGTAAVHVPTLCQRGDRRKAACTSVSIQQKRLWRAFQMFRINVLAEVAQESSSMHAGCLLVNPPVQSKKRFLICPLFTVLCVRSLTQAISFQSAHKGAHVPIVSSA